MLGSKKSSGGRVRPSAEIGGGHSHLKRVDYSAVASRVLLHREIKRPEVAKETGLSSGSVTKHTNWLKDKGFLEVERVPVSHAKKPIDLLSLIPGSATALIVVLHQNVVISELVGMDLKPFYRSKVVLPAANQVDLLAAFQEVVLAGLDAAEEFGRTLDTVGLGVAGWVDSRDGIIYSLQGIPNWDACQPWEILPEIKRRSPKFNVWPEVACKVRGICQELRCDDQVAYIDCSGGTVSLAAMHGGDFKAGRHGTSSYLLHQTITDATAKCYCGRAGCFYHYLEDGTITPKLLIDGLKAVIGSLPEDSLVVELNSTEMNMGQALRELNVSDLRLLKDGTDYLMVGLRALSAQAAIEAKIHSLVQ